MRTGQEPFTRFRDGMVIGGRYEIEAFLGRGGMGEVHVALDRLLGRRVALKALRDGLAERERFLPRFRREARIIAALNHPNIVTLFDAGVHGATPFIVMELVEGETLAAQLRGGSLPPDRATEIAAGLARALDAAHRANIVHRDLKPSNVILTPAGLVKLLDFGVARAVEWTPITETPAVRGTPEYLAPEQIEGGDVDGRADIYALGVVLYEMLTGSPPFVGETPVAVAYRHVREAPPPLPARVAPQLREIVQRCLAKRPEARYRRAREVGRALRRFHDGGPESTITLHDRTPLISLPAHHDEPDQDASPRTRGWRALVAFVAGAAIASAAAWLAVTLPADEQRPRPQLLAVESLTADGACDGFMETRVDLSWTPSASPATDGYEIYRAEDAGEPFVLVGVVTGRTTSSYTHSGVERGSTGRYVVKSTGGGRTGPASAPAIAETPSICLF